MLNFPKTNKLHKIFNKNTVKVSYNCMSNMTSILSSHNLNVINTFKTQTYSCNYRTEKSCPLQNQCLTPKIIYEADVENDTNSETKFYFGLTKTPFKNRFEIILEISSIKCTLKALNHSNIYGI